MTMEKINDEKIKELNAFRTDLQSSVNASRQLIKGLFKNYNPDSVRVGYGGANYSIISVIFNRRKWWDIRHWFSSVNTTVKDYLDKSIDNIMQQGLVEGVDANNLPYMTVHVSEEHALDYALATICVHRRTAAEQSLESMVKQLTMLGLKKTDTDDKK